MYSNPQPAGGAACSYTAYCVVLRYIDGRNAVSKILFVSSQVIKFEQLMKITRKNVTIVEKNLLSNQDVFPIVRLDALFLVCGG